MKLLLRSMYLYILRTRYWEQISISSAIAILEAPKKPPVKASFLTLCLCSAPRDESLSEMAYKISVISVISRNLVSDFCDFYRFSMILNDFQLFLVVSYDFCDFQVWNPCYQVAINPARGTNFAGTRWAHIGEQAHTKIRKMINWRSYWLQRLNDMRRCRTCWCHSLA